MKSEKVGFRHVLLSHGVSLHPFPYPQNIIITYFHSLLTTTKCTTLQNTVYTITKVKKENPQLGSNVDCSGTALTVLLIDTPIT